MKTTMLCRRLASWQVAAVLTLAGGAVFAAHPPIFDSSNSVSDILGAAHETDPLLVNPWGLVPGPEGNLHVADDGSGFATLYSPDGTLLSATVPITIPQAAVTSGSTGSPTGIVANEASLLLVTDSNDFDIASGTNTLPAHYLYATEDGAIIGYRAKVDPTAGIKAADQSSSGAGYTGLALAWVTGASGTLEHRLYAANFAQGKIDVFNSSFGLVALTGTDTFTDPSPPNIPQNAPPGSTWSPFNVKSVDFPAKAVDHRPGVLRRILVAYALHSGTSNPLNDIPGQGWGYVATFNPDGAFVAHLIPPFNHLNSPWGMAVSHHPFARFPGRGVLLVGNHGDGTINAYVFTPGEPLDGDHIATLVKDKESNALAFDGLWALHFGPKKVSPAEYLLTHAILDEDDRNLYFSAGIVGETHGLVGRILLP